MKRLLTLALCSVLLFTGCSSNDTTSTDASTGTSNTQTTSNSDELTEVTIVLDWTPNTNHTGLYVAKELGYYEELGLDVSIIQPPEGSSEILVATNKAEFGISMQDSLATALISNDPLPITAVASIIQHNTSGLISLAETEINSPKDLEGKTYATWDMPIEKAMIEDIMTKDGGDFSNLTLIPSTVTDVITALQTDIDAVWIYYAWDGIATELNELETNYLDFGEILPEFDFYTPVIIASNDFLESNPDKAKAFLQATAKGYYYSISNPTQASEILVKHAPELDLDLVIASQEYLAEKYVDDATKWGYIDIARWDSFYNWIISSNLIDGEYQSGFGVSIDYLS